MKMKEELSWVCSIMPEATNRKIVSLCRELNQEIGLPETVFKFPLHISLKKSFRTQRYEEVYEDAFQPHISLFTSGDRDDIMDMYKLLKEEDLRLGGRGVPQVRDWLIRSSRYVL
jgi:hypothetical protein